MRTGISSPIVALAGGRPEWEVNATVADLVEVAQVADRLGYEFMTCSDHVAVPVGVARGERFYDPLSTFSFLAAHTTRLRFLSYVLVLGYYQPLELAKRYGTFDHLSGGRLTLGVGVGGLQEEFEMLGASFDDRGPRADDALRALRAAWGKRVVNYDGPYFSFSNLAVEPHGAQQHLPIWVGGHTMKSLHRAVALGDGWAPSPVQFRGPDHPKLAGMLAEVEVPDGFDVLTGSAMALDPVGNPEQVRHELGAAADAGGTVFRLAVKHRTKQEYFDQLAAYAEIANLTRLR